MAEPQGPTTRAEAIIFGLTESIVTLRLPPGSVLDEATLAQTYGASRTPVREALRALAASGLVELRPHRAPRVASFDEARVSQMFDVMTELEALCAAWAARAMTPQARGSLERFHRDVGAVVREGNVDAYRTANARFHEMIYDGSANGYLRDLTLTTRERLAPYRAVQLDGSRRIARSYAEHGAIVAAILCADEAGAARLMREHLSLTRTALADLRQKPTD